MSNKTCITCIHAKQIWVKPDCVHEPSDREEHDVSPCAAYVDRTDSIEIVARDMFACVWRISEGWECGGEPDTEIFPCPPLGKKPCHKYFEARLKALGA